ncbi:MAG: Mov34/MPN/PAD-1 family protein [Sphingobium sp.]
MMARISRALLARILEEAAASPNREICGLLLGEGMQIMDILPAANVADDPARRFEIDPAVLLRAHREARREGAGGARAIIGHYHSHPGGEARPSSCDGERAHGDGALWLICTPQGDRALWIAAGEGLHGQFLPVTLQPE